jgi:ATP phosphoribosyltransferase
VPIKIALPKGRFADETAALLREAGWGLTDYHRATRYYRLKSRRSPQLTAKTFHEKDIPIQVAVGNYDLGICGLDWVEELLVKYPSLNLLKISNLGYGDGHLYMVASRPPEKPRLEEISARQETIRIASEYPNLAESFALRNRLRRFSIFPLWGAAEVYPPESADLALVPRQAAEPLNHNLAPLGSILSFSAFIIANKRSWETEDLSEIIASIEDIAAPRLAEMRGSEEQYPAPADTGATLTDTLPPEDAVNLVRLALPDGHQQPPTLHLLNKAGIQVDDYPSDTGNRRPTTSLPGVAIKVIRPQDMPLQVANGNFDLAITGRDWLKEHLCQFPTSPVTEFLDLKYGRVKVVAVVSRDMPVDEVYELRQLCKQRQTPLQVASEYVNMADKYARDNRLGLYRIIPTWGASEAFLPEDADLLIENTETGRTIARHNLKIIETLFESTACLIGRKDGQSGKDERMKSVVKMLKAAVEDS